ncbi:C39 family peptidase [Thermovorax subterraneus]|nr:C39 family peptidase [Thermovorax subterraneus]
MRKSIFKLSVIGTCIILLTVSIPIFAEDNSLIIENTEKKTGAMLNDPNLIPEMIEMLKQEALMKDRKMREKEKNYTLPMGDPDGVEYYSVNVTNFKQETYYCGPASVRQSLSFHKAKSGSSVSLPSQTTIAKLAGTTSEGNVTTGLRTAINNYASTYGFEDDKYVVGNVTDGSNPSYLFEVRIRDDLKYRTNAPIILIDTRHLDYYKGYKTRHYVTVCGYLNNKNTGEKELYIVDPNNKDEYRGYHWEKLENVFNAVEQADKDGTNYVMLY